MASKAKSGTNGHQPAASPGRKPNAREIARFERFVASRRPITAVMSEAEADAHLREALKHVDKKQFLREAKALREQMKERQAALVQSRPKRNSAKRD